MIITLFEKFSTFKQLVRYKSSNEIAQNTLYIIVV